VQRTAVLVRRTAVPVQHTAQDELQCIAQDELQRTAQDEMQRTAQDELQRTAQNELQCTAQNELQRTAQDKLQHVAQDKLQHTALLFLCSALLFLYSDSHAAQLYARTTYLSVFKSRGLFRLWSPISLRGVAAVQLWPCPAIMPA
jgi:hypothetical protein